MNLLTTCPQCSSLNPHTVSSCLNCDEALLSGGSSLKKRLLKTAGVVAVSMTLTACYGGGDMPAPNCYDGDQDGYCEFEDCNDEDPNVNSGEGCLEGETPNNGEGT